jgi:hypothetical protein
MENLEDEGNAMKKLFVFAAILFLLICTAPFVPSPASAVTTYLIYNQWGGTWHDANKTYVDDSLMCWAASASNILDWGNWETPTYNTESKIFQNFKDHWTNNRGWQSWAWNWWLTGAQPPTKTYAYVNVPGGGKYYPEENFYDYYTTAFGASEISAMDQLMHNGYGISLVIGTTSGASHAVTAWGFDYDLVNGKTTYTAIYVTDSDDKVTALKKMGLAYNTNNGWYLTSGYTNWKINGVYGFEMNTGLISVGSNYSLPYSAAAPISPTWWLFAGGILLMAGVGLRKKQNLSKNRLFNNSLS